MALRETFNTITISPPSFTKLWLDQLMVYTCAYFPNEEASLEEAQQAKFDLVCRKLWLRPGETVVEAGCGWGSLAMYMAEHYGVKVKAFNISHEQIRVAREMAKQKGLSCMVEFVEDDYRNITGSYDAFVSVGMLEHVGREHYPELGRVIQRSIGDRGRGLLHFIGRRRSLPFSVWIRKRIFPGAYAPTLRESMEVLEPHAYYVLDVEDLRLHYARTIEHWLSRFERTYDSVVQLSRDNICAHVAALSCGVHRCLSGRHTAVVPGRIQRSPLPVGSMDA